MDPRLLPHLPFDRLLGRFPGRNVSSEDREATLCPADAPAEQHVAGAVVDEHDHHRVGAREVGSPCIVGQRRERPASATRVPAPQTEQNLWRRCQLSRATR